MTHVFMRKSMMTTTEHLGYLCGSPSRSTATNTGGQLHIYHYTGTTAHTVKKH